MFFLWGFIRLYLDFQWWVASNAEGLSHCKEGKDDRKILGKCWQEENMGYFTCLNVMHKDRVI